MSKDLYHRHLCLLFEGHKALFTCFILESRYVRIGWLLEEMAFFCLFNSLLSWRHVVDRGLIFNTLNIAVTLWSQEIGNNSGAEGFGQIAFFVSRNIIWSLKKCPYNHRKAAFWNIKKIIFLNLIYIKTKVKFRLIIEILET